ncbi:hypothetical protein AYO44_05425 [Planctomycetaceae bacterium SCGC AG-212-F19]|nr:hypothetical protein AYO44_05425 [Planctomycetaceae bacterium SCGC AG-212-F19]
MSKLATRQWVLDTFDVVNPSKATYNQELKKVKKALKLGRAVKAYKPTIDAYYKEAQRFAKLKDYDQALAKLKLTHDTIRNALRTAEPGASRDSAKRDTLAKKAAFLHETVKKENLNLGNLDLDAEHDAIYQLLANDDLDTAEDRIEALTDLVKTAREPLTKIHDHLKELLQHAQQTEIGVDLAKAKEVTTFLTQGNAAEARKSYLLLRRAVDDLESIQKALERLNADIKGSNFDLSPLDFATERTAILDKIKHGKLDEARPKLVALKRAVRKAEDALPLDQKQQLRAKRRKDKLDRRDARVLELAKNHPQLLHEYQQLNRDDPKDERRALEMYVKIVQANGGQFRANDADSANPSYWLDSNDPDGKTKHKFLFKEYSSEKKLPGFPEGGSALREDMTRALSERLGSMTGMEMDVPETQLVEVDRNGKKQIGSLQHFARSKGEGNPRGLSGAIKEDPTILDAIPKQECQKIAVLDLVSLAMDRHEENLMLRGEGDDTQVVPIDHGVTLPDRDGMNNRIGRLGLHALARANGSREPFDPELIKKLDEAAIEKELRDSLKSMKDAHPEAASDDMFGEENITLVKRSVQFLKKAAAAGMTPAELYSAYMVFKAEIFDSPENEKDTKFDQVIRTAKARKQALFTLQDLVKTDGKGLFTFATANQWWDSEMLPEFAFFAWAQFYPDKVPLVHQRQLKGPLANPTEPTSNAKGKIPQDTNVSKYVKEFGVDTTRGVNASDWELWQQYERLGGTPMYLNLGGNLGFGKKVGRGNLYLDMASALSNRLRIFEGLIQLRDALAGVT